MSMEEQFIIIVRSVCMLSSQITRIYMEILSTESNIIAPRELVSIRGVNTRQHLYRSTECSTRCHRYFLVHPKLSRVQCIPCKKTRGSSCSDDPAFNVLHVHWGTNLRPLTSLQHMYPHLYPPPLHLTPSPSSNPLSETVLLPNESTTTLLFYSLLLLPPLSSFFLY